MFNPNRVIILACSLILLSHIVGRADEPAWRPVTPEEIAMKSPLVEPGADAEAIFWEVWLDDKKLNSIFYEHYIRVKIFTERGRERFSKFDIPYTKGMKVENIAARVIKPDGTIIVLDPKDIFEREIVKAGKIKVMAKSFAVPAIEPGVIVEYRYRETYKDSWGNGLRLSFQRDIPMQKVVYHVRPQAGFSLVARYYNMPETRFVKDVTEEGFYTAAMTNVPGFKSEPQMPPDDEVKRWAYLSYTVREAGAVWRGVNTRYGPWLTTYAKPTDLVKKKAAELTKGATTDDEKLQRIYEYLQKHIKNVDYDRKLTDDERDKLDDFDHAEDVIKRGMGNSIYIELLFASLAKAAGYEVNLVFSGDRSESFFSPVKYPYPSFVHLACIAVNVQSTWRYFNSSVPYLPYGYLTWTEEGVTAMFIADDSFSWRSMPVTDPSRSLAKRTAELTLLEDGTLEGNVRIEYNGQQAISRRRDDLRASEDKRKESAEREVKARINTAEISALTIENIDDPSKPLVYAFKVRVANYAQRTGQRLFLQPGFFEYGVQPLFSAATREHQIHFAYPWSENDSVEIHLPKGFELDSPDRPPSISDAKKIGSLSVQMNYDKDTGVLRYKRDFYFGGSGAILFPAAAYAPLKSLFDNFHKSDSHVVSLKLINR